MIENIKAQWQRHRDFRAVLREGAQQLREADPRPIGLLLGTLQFAGGWYLFVPFARFVPPFSKLFDALPAWAWAIYFIMSGIVAMVSSLLPDGTRFLCARFRVAVWMFFNWCFLTITSFLAVMWIAHGGAGAVNYGIAFAFYPCLAAAATWKVLCVRQMLADETAEDAEQDNHVRELKEAAAARDERLKAMAAMSEV